jgi:thiamine biosynthesis lipoprotein
MSALQWRDWSCTVRIVLGDGRPADAAPEPSTADRAERLLRGLMDDVSVSASRFRVDSDLSRVNAAAGLLVPVRALTLELVDVALDAARRTGGACDPTLGRQLLAAGYDADIAEVRARDVFVGRDHDRAVDWEAVRIDRQLGRLGVPANLWLDLGATAKAWSADAAAARLARAFGTPVLVAIGGDLATAGPLHTWPVLVGENEDGPGQVIDLHGGAIATSSTQGRRWLTTTGEAHHLIDPSTGAPVDGPYRTASVLADSCTEANSLSTAALVWGADARERLAERAARLVDTRGRVVTTGSWPGAEIAA